MKLSELKEQAAALGYELRKKGVKREKHNETDSDGNPVKNCYMPHLAITASALARTWKMLEDAKKAFGYDCDKNGEVWTDKLLLGCEHIVRFINRKIDDNELGYAINRLVSVLPKSEHIKRAKKAK